VKASLAASTCLAVFVASFTWFVPLMLAVIPLVLIAGAYVRRWWFALGQAVPFVGFVALTYYDVHHPVGSEPGLAAMMCAVAAGFYLLLAIGACLIGWIGPWLRRTFWTIEPRSS
jgi:hypothetical protein